jgi:hypothetical protein
LVSLPVLIPLPSAASLITTRAAGVIAITRWGEGGIDREKESENSEFVLEANKNRRH